MSSICDSCHAGCCRAYRLIITIYDFLDLVNAVGLEKAVNATTFESMPYNPNYAINKNIMFPFIFDNEGKKGLMYSLALKKVDSLLFPGTTKCSFLHEESRPEPNINPELRNHSQHPGSKVSAMCSVYENRPTMCRTYPIGFNPNTNTSLLRRRENLPNAAEKAAYQICPKEQLELTDFGLTKPETIMKKNDELLLSDARTHAHNEAVTRWNSQPERSIDKVVSFILGIGNSLIASYQAPKMQAPPIIETSIPQAAKALKKKAGQRV
jgi:Fe-S-cluster containining protein